MKIQLLIVIVLSHLLSCNEVAKKTPVVEKKETAATVELIILGTLQDAGSPHIACKKECCADLFENPDSSRKVVSLGIIDHVNKETFLFEATPDISEQAKLLKNHTSWDATELPTRIFLTHAHIGHYTGLMFLGKEATNANHLPVYAMPKMKTFLEENGPWSQLVSNKNIDLHPIVNKKSLSMTSALKIVPMQVPHRDEFSETVGYKIIGPNKTALFIPDIDKWEKWETSITELIKTVDFAFLDASFFDGDELNTRDISQIPHPFVIESIGLFKNLSATDKAKVHFIHFNHTNGLLNTDSKQTKQVLENGFNIAQFKQVFEL